MRLALATVLLWALLGGVAQACTRVAASNAAIDPGRIDQARLSQAILGEVNFVRCQAGRRAVTAAPGTLIQSATAHSVWMAQAGTLSHQGRGASGRGLADRVRSAGLRVRTAGENIAQLPRYTFGSQRFRVIDRGACVFQTRAGRQIPPHSYQSLARQVVALWMASPGHRRNVLDPDVSAMGAGAAFSQSNTCGDYWVTQIFVG
ncbi:MAG: CAP domain-containing protein [Pseudomonadota bacterium]